VRNKLSVAILAVAISSVLGLGAAWGQTAPQAKKAPEWKDRAEYDLYQSISSEQDPNKKLDLLNQWKDKYATSGQIMLRLEQYLATYKQLSQAAKMLDTAQEMLKEDPKYVNGLFWTCLLIVSMNDPAPAKLDLGDQAANTLLGILDDVFAPDKKPAAATDAAWKQGRTDLEALAHRTLGWVNWKRQSPPDAEKHLVADLKLNPNDAEASYWLGLILRKVTGRNSDALFYIARAASYDGPGALDAATRPRVLDFVTKDYTAYHGPDPDGLKQLLAVAKTQALPPADFKILSAQEVSDEKMKELAGKDPGLPLWVRLKGALTADGGAQYWESIKGAVIPPEDQPTFRGTVISQEGLHVAKSVVLGIVDAKVPEVTLTFDPPIAGKVEPGTVLHFRGVASKFVADPFMLTFAVEKKDVTGWPAPAPVHRPVKKAAQQ
jgi:hypothetical protein